VKAVVYDQPRSFAVAEVSDPHAGPAEVSLTRDGGTVFGYGTTDENGRLAVSLYEAFLREAVVRP
jgi:hypothetical protein